MSATALQHATSDSGMRIPAREIEIAVTERLAAMLDDPLTLIGAAWLDVQPDQIRELSDAAARLAATVRSRSHVPVRQLIYRRAGRSLRHRDQLRWRSAGDNARREPVEGAPANLQLRADVRLTRTGKMMRLVTPDGGAAAAGPDPALLRLLAKAHRWWHMLRTEPIDVTRLAEREGVAPAYLTRVLRLAFLSPEVTARIIAGQQSAVLTVASLTLPDAVSPNWLAQRRVLPTD